ncbi:hypothetical protein DEVEQU_03824 [Devosia equisanguinis]|uniref:DUF1214 domain-containing protein n=2 Tax=Devosia TaxID=46913 RepID=A0A3S4DT40_9HYPH|nr:DUF1214 domain-containing protein [Devosia equisanguinis]VDS06660.1 hypothetical protein DEVEQU_03824 [Devosia equisanguinis]
MRFVLRLLLSIAVALCVGFGLSYYALTDGRLFGAREIGPWISWPDVGAPSPNPYTRGHLTRDGALQLGRSEGLQFIATTDSAGGPLDLACTYRLDGRVPVSAFWTLAAVNADWVNLSASPTQPAIRSSEVVRDTSGALRVSVGTRLSPYTWLELAGSGAFSLVLTLYDTTALSGSASADLSLPTITRGDCA